MQQSRRLPQSPTEAQVETARTILSRLRSVEQWAVRLELPTLVSGIQLAIDEAERIIAAGATGNDTDEMTQH